MSIQLLRIFYNIVKFPSKRVKIHSIYIIFVSMNYGTQDPNTQNYYR